MKIDSLEAGRGIAALAVVLFHMNAIASIKGLPTFSWLETLLHGVDFFFVISGFIIFFVHRKDIGRSGAGRMFAIKRFIRLYPTLWLIASIWIIVAVVRHKPVSAEAIASTLTLMPSMTTPIPDVIWTLRHELLFYGVFLILTLNRRAGITAFAAWTALVLVQLALATIGRPMTGIVAFFASSYEIDFLLGGLVALRAPTIAPSVIPILAAAMVVVCALACGDYYHLYRLDLVDYTSIAATWWVIALGLCFSFVLYGMLAIESLIHVPRWAIALGGCSYALYLVHVPIQGVLANGIGRFPAWLVMGSMIVVPIAAAAALHFGVEQPLGRRLRRAWLD